MKKKLICLLLVTALLLALLPAIAFAAETETLIFVKDGESYVLKKGDDADPAAWYSIDPADYGCSISGNTLTLKDGFSYETTGIGLLVVDPATIYVEGKAELTTTGDKDEEDALTSKTDLNITGPNGILTLNASGHSLNGIGCSGNLNISCKRLEANAQNTGVGANHNITMNCETVKIKGATAGIMAANAELLGGKYDITGGLIGIYAEDSIKARCDALRVTAAGEDSMALGVLGNTGSIDLDVKELYLSGKLAAAVALGSLTIKGSLFASAEAGVENPTETGTIRQLTFLAALIADDESAFRTVAVNGEPARTVKASVPATGDHDGAMILSAALLLLASFAAVMTLKKSHSAA